MSATPSPHQDTTKKLCTLCRKQVEGVQFSGVYRTANCPVLNYALCPKCLKRVKAGLPPERQHELDQRLEKYAFELGYIKSKRTPS